MLLNGAELQRLTPQGPGQIYACQCVQWASLSTDLLLLVHLLPVLCCSTGDGCRATPPECSYYC